MGTWGPHSFDNDAARDWRSAAAPIRRATVETAFAAVFDSDGSIDADTGATALAAAEVVAGARYGVAGGDVTLTRSDAQALTEDAVHVIMSLTGERSELAQLWRDAGPDEHDGWVAALRDLRARLEGTAGGFEVR